MKKWLILLFISFFSLALSSPNPPIIWNSGPVAKIIADQGLNITQSAASALTAGTPSSTAIHKINGGLVMTTRTVNSSFTIDTATTDYNIFTDTSGGVVSIKLPQPTNGRTFIIKDVKGTFSINNLILLQNTSEKIDGLAASKIFKTNWGSWLITSDGTDWFVNANAAHQVVQILTATANWIAPAGVTSLDAYLRPGAGGGAGGGGGGAGFDGVSGGGGGGGYGGGGGGAATYTMFHFSVTPGTSYTVMIGAGGAGGRGGDAGVTGTPGGNSLGGGDGGVTSFDVLGTAGRNDPATGGQGSTSAGGGNNGTLSAGGTATSASTLGTTYGLTGAEPRLGGSGGNGGGPSSTGQGGGGVSETISNIYGINLPVLHGTSGGLASGTSGGGGGSGPGGNGGLTDEYQFFGQAAPSGGQGGTPGDGAAGGGFTGTNGGDGAAGINGRGGGGGGGGAGGGAGSTGGKGGEGGKGGKGSDGVAVLIWVE